MDRDFSRSTLHHEAMDRVPERECPRFLIFEIILHKLRAVMFLAFKVWEGGRLVIERSPT